MRPERQMDSCHYGTDCAPRLAAGAGDCKTLARDRWLGWRREQQFRRLHLAASNTRFLVLPNVEAPDLASRVRS